MTSCANIAAMGPVQFCRLTWLPDALPCPRRRPAQTQPIVCVSHEPLLKPAMNTRAPSTHCLADTSASTSSKYLTSGPGGEYSKQSPTDFNATTIASSFDACSIGNGVPPLPVQPCPRTISG